MASYLRSWFTPSDSTAESFSPQVPDFSVQVSPPHSDDEDGSETETDLPPTFPSINSAQRLQSARRKAPLTDAQLMPPPALPMAKSNFQPSSSLAVPTTTTKKPSKPIKNREKVALAPGHSPLDWANLKSSGQDLRGVDTLSRITPSMLNKHNKRDDAWSAFYGKVYNITPYLSFHPGGEKELMRVAGRDGTKLFASTHAWVNVDFMLDACLVGFLVSEPTS